MTLKTSVMRHIRDDCYLFCPDDGCRILARRAGFGFISGDYLLEGRENASERQFLSGVLPRPFAGDLRSSFRRGGENEESAPRFWFFINRDRRGEGVRPLLIDRALYAATGLCLAVIPHLEPGKVAAVLQSGACGSIGWSPAASGHYREEIPFDAETFSILDGIFFALCRGIFCRPNQAFSDAEIPLEGFEAGLAVLAEFVGCRLADGAELPVARTFFDPRLHPDQPYGKNYAAATVGWRCRPEIGTAFLLCAMFAARETAPDRTLRVGDFAAPDPMSVTDAGGAGHTPSVLAFCRRLADATGTHFGVSIEGGTLTLYMDFLTYDAQIPEGLKADPARFGSSFSPTVVLRLAPKT